MFDKIKSFELDNSLFAWWNKKSIYSRTAFYSALLIGFITHIYVYTHRFMNEDDFLITASATPNVGSGRWFNGIIHQFMYDYTPPIIIGLFVIISIAVSAFLICDIFKISKKVNAILIGGLLVTFPTIASFNGYLFDAGANFFAALLSVTAFYLTFRYKYGCLFGSVLIMLTMAIYQSKVNLALSLCLFYVIMQLFNKKSSVKDVFGSIIRTLLLSVLGAALYFASVRVSLDYYDMELYSYKGIDSMGSISLTEIPNMIKAAYMDFYNGFFGDYYISGQFLKYAYIIVGIILIAFVVNLIIKQKIYKQPIKLILVLLTLPAAPIALNFAGFMMKGGVETSLLMMYSFVLIFILAILFAEKALISPSLKSILSISLLFIMLNYMTISNVYYLKLDMYYQSTFSLTTRVLTRVDPLLAQSESKRVAIVGSLSEKNYNDSSEVFKRSTIKDQGLDRVFIGYTYDYYYKFIINVFSRHGIALSGVTEEDIINIQSEISLMPYWPAEGSVALIDDIIIINLG